MSTKYNEKQHEKLKDLKVFTAYCFEGMGLPLPAPLQNDVLEYMANPSEGDDGKFRVQIQAMRGCGKSVMSAISVLYRLYWKPDEKILVISATTDLAAEFIGLTRKLMELDMFKHMAPRKAQQGSPTGKDQADSQQAIDCGHQKKPSKDPSIAAFGMGSNITGKHPTVIIADDCEVVNNSDTPGKREKLLKQFAEFEAMIKKGGTLVILGTPHSTDSIYLRLRESYPLRKWPAEYPDPDDVSQSADVAPSLLQAAKLDDTLIGKATCPELHDDADLKVKREIAPYPGHYEMQMLLNPALLDENRYPLKGSDLIVMNCDPFSAPDRVIWGNVKEHKKIEFNGINNDALYEPMLIGDLQMPYDASVMSIDPAGRGADETTYAIVKVCNGFFYVLDVGGFKGVGHADAVMTRLAQKAEQYQVNQVLVESNFGDGLFTKILAPVMANINGPTDIKDVRVQGQKEQRIIDTIQPLTFSHRLIFNTKVAKDKEMMKQFTRITRAKNSLTHDDRIDALALGLKHLSEWAEVDPDKVGIQRAEAARDAISQQWADDPRMALDHFTFLSDAVKHTSTTRKPNARTKKWGWGRR